jgi:hypothetical protein
MSRDTIIGTGWTSTSDGCVDDLADALAINDAALAIRF